MDGKHFDSMTRRLAEGATRRGMLRTGLALAGAALGLGALNEASAHRRFGQICRTNGDCASGTCGPKDSTGRRRCTCAGVTSLAVECCETADCPAGRICLSNGTCAVPCPSGGSDCQAAACGNRCIGTVDGNVCSVGGASASCSNANIDCPPGTACSGAICETVC